jgi:hypothetical protein
LVLRRCKSTEKIFAMLSAQEQFVVNRVCRLHGGAENRKIAAHC